MFDTLRIWLKRKRKNTQQPPASVLRKTGAIVSPKAAKPAAGRRKTDEVPAPVLDSTPFEGRIEERGPGKNVLIRNKYRRADTGTHETLTILDDSIVDTGEETGIDPYNTGSFDRSKNWDKRFRN
tara:strand:- start:3061 stop:3435 length:375 start_codon:yes stop_codon:yes gene_type:complete